MQESRSVRSASTEDRRFDFGANAVGVVGVVGDARTSVGVIPLTEREGRCDPAIFSGGRCNERSASEG